MTSEQPNEASIFNAVRKIESADERTAFLNEACGDDTGLRERVDQLLTAFVEKSQFLEQPAPGLEQNSSSPLRGDALEQTQTLDSPENDFAASLDAGLAATFCEESAVVVGNTNHSVLKSMSASFEVPRVLLRESKEAGEEPIQRPNSPEIPVQSSDSRYRIDGEIARGGMGAVMRGRDTDLGRDLAVKVLLDAHKDRPEVVQRFIEEAQIGGQLQHPGIAPVYELGQFADQRPFFSMKLVKGDTLAKLLSDRDDPATDRSKLVGIFEQVCQTMAYAHSRGVIHRDLKPANIMVGAFGEVQVMDWGLAKVLSVGGVADEKTARRKQNGETMIQTMRSVGSDAPGTVGSVGSETQMGSVMGTPAYMPPEQALGEIDMLDQRADVFGLGAILAEILTGKPPYVAEDGTQIYRMASRGKLGDCFARLDECGADEELVRLAKKCLEPEPANRPKDAGALAEQVTGYLESVETKLRESEVELAGEAARVVEQRKRFRVTLGLSAAALTILLAGIVATAWQAREAKRQTRVAQDARNEATEERDHAREAEQKAVLAKTAAEDARAAEEKAKQQQEAIARQRRRELYAADMQLADQLYNGQNGEQKRIQQILASWIPVDDQEDLREFSWRHQWTRLHHSASVTVRVCKGVAITPTGKMVVADADGLHEVDADGEKSKLIDWKLEHSWALFSPDGRWVASKFESGVELYNIDSGKKVLSLPQTRPSFSANGKFFAAWKGGTKVDSLGEDEDAIPVWKLNGENATPIDPLVIGEMSWLPGFANALKLGSDGKSFLRRQEEKVWAWLNRNPDPKLWFHRDNADCAWSPDGKIIASASSLIELRLNFGVAKKRTLDKLTFSSHGKQIQTIRFSPDGRVLATGGNDGTIDLWDVSTVAAAVERMGLPDQEQTKAKDSIAAPISSFPKPRLIRTIKAFTNSILNLDTALSFSQDGSLLAARDSDGNVKLWNLKNLPGKYQMDHVTTDLYGWSIPYYYAGLRDGDYHLRIARVLPDDIVKGRPPQRHDRIRAVFDPDKGDWLFANGIDTWYDFQQLAYGARDGEVRLKLENPEGEQYEVTLRRQGQFFNQSPRSFSVAFAPDDDSLVVSDDSIGATRLKLENHEAIRYPQKGRSAAYSPDGRLLAMDSGFGVSIRDLESDEQLYFLDLTIDSEWSANTLGGNLAFSPDGKYLAHVSGYRYTNQRSDLNVWRTSDFKKVGGRPLRQKDITMSALSFSPDSARLFAGDYAGVVEIWNTSDWTQEASIETFVDQISSLVISSDGNRLITGTYRDGTVIGGSVGIWDVETKEELGVLGSSTVCSLALSPDDRTLAVGGKDHNVVLWDMETGKRLQNIQAHSESIFGIAFSDDGNRLATLSVDGVLHVWDAETCSEIEDDPMTVDLLFATGNSHWRQKRFAEGEKTTALALELNRKSGHLSEKEATDSVQFTRRMMKKLGYWPRIKEETGNWPSFTTQPPKTLGTKLGEDVALSAEVADGDWSYQWFHNGNPIDGANSPSLELENVSTAELGSYRLEVLGEDLRPLYQKKCVATIFLVNEGEKVMKGHLLREVFLDLRLGTLKGLEANSRFRNNQPDLTGVVDCWETPKNVTHFYGQRVSGFVVPPKTGDYVFYLASDDESELFLSSDESEENYQRIARVKQEMREDATSVGYMNPRAWGDHPNSVSEPIHLEAGKRYAIKGIMADGILGDHFAVTWQMPGGEPPKPGAPPIPGEYLEFEIK